MYFVSGDNNELFLYTSEKLNTEPIAKLTKGSYFGELSILSDRPTKRTASVKCGRYPADLYSLSRSSFSKVLHAYPELEKTIVVKVSLYWKKR